MTHEPGREVAVERPLEGRVVAGLLDERGAQRGVQLGPPGEVDLGRRAGGVDDLGERDVDTGRLQGAAERDGAIGQRAACVPSCRHVPDRGTVSEGVATRQDIDHRVAWQHWARKSQRGGSMSEYTTVFGSLDDYEKGRVIVIDDDPKAYVFSNVFEVANSSKPYEKVAVGKNLEYVLEVIRCEGTSEWRVTPHDEFALVMDGTVVIELLDPDRAARRPRRAGFGRASTASRPGRRWVGSRRGAGTRRCCPPASATGSTATASA